MPASHRSLFVYLGRRGALSRTALDIAALKRDDAVVLVSRQNEIYGRIKESGADVIGVDTFAHSAGALLQAGRIPAVRRTLAETIANRGIDRVVTLMSHVWSPLLAGAVKGAGARYVVIVHDGAPHPGDRTGLVHGWLIRDAFKADTVVALSDHVSREVAECYPALHGRVHTLFLPLIGDAQPAQQPRPGQPLRFLFFGRIMLYKGPDLFTRACEILRRDKVPFEASVVGEGDLGDLRPRLEAAGVAIDNRWIGEDEVGPVLLAHDAVVVSSIQASQSGVVAAAFAAGLPVVATPVGGLAEQVRDGVDGLLAAAVSAEAVAAQMRRLVREPPLLALLSSGVRATHDRISIARFVDSLHALPG